MEQQNSRSNSSIELSKYIKYFMAIRIVSKYSLYLLINFYKFEYIN